jgi:selenocysteine-specific elongation factor
MNDFKKKLGPSRQYVIGTAGHIDHGKTALVKALTGIDTDRLPEEKKRGITIDLGFAHFTDNVTIIDVPGHEKLIKNMVSGVASIDMVLLVIAADDGIMPQTREHLDIINLLQIHHGIIAITKIDLVDEEWLTLVEDDIRGLISNTPFKDSMIIKSSAITNEGVNELSEKVINTLAEIPSKRDLEIFREPVDRAFGIKGFGSVITGTVLSGRLRSGDQVEIQPQGLKARIRKLQSHDIDVEEVTVGYRAAVNLAGVELEQLHRGQVLVQPDLYEPVILLNARLHLLKSSPKGLKNNQRVRLHIHTAEVFARLIVFNLKEIKPGESAYVQFRLENPIHAGFEDRFIIRQYSPQITIGGGIVLQTNPIKYRKKYQTQILKSLKMLEGKNPEEMILASFDLFHFQPSTLLKLKIKTNIPMVESKKVIEKLLSEKIIFFEKIGVDTFYYSKEQLELVLDRITLELGKYHYTYPGRIGLTKSEIIGKLEKLFSSSTLNKALNFGIKQTIIVDDNGALRLKEFTPQISIKETKLYQQISQFYKEAKYTPPTWKEVLDICGLTQKDFKEIANNLRKEGILVYLDENILIHCSALEELEKMIKEYFEKNNEISVPQFKELTDTTRKHAIPLLNYLDNRGMTERDGDVRIAAEKRH